MDRTVSRQRWVVLGNQIQNIEVRGQLNLDFGQWLRQKLLDMFPKDNLLAFKVAN